MRCFALTVLAFQLLASPILAAPNVANRWALLIGVDDYANANDLSFCGADQASLRKQLLTSGFADDHIFLLHDSAADNKYRPSKRNIEKQLSIVLNLAEVDDLIVVAFSGHGVSLDGRSYLCPNDAELESPETLVAVDDLYDQLKNCAASFKLVLVDACRNDPRPGGRRSLTPTDGTKALARSFQEARLPEGVVLLNSCAPGEISWEEQEFGHGVFMHYVLEGLAGGADKSGDGAVSLTELQAYAGERTKVYVARKFNDSQRPFFRGDLTTEALEYALLPVTPGTQPPTAVMTPAPVVEPSSNAPPFAIAPFDAAAAKAHQEAWAKHLGFDVEFTDSNGTRFRLIPPGEYMMGCEEDALGVLRRFDYATPDAISDSYPLHKTRITKPFYISKYEITLGQFLNFYHDAGYKVDCERGKMGEGWQGDGCKRQRGYVPWNWGFRGQTNNHPAVNLSWNDAAAYCEWLSRREGKTYRLPTEVEWEFACKAGTTTRYWFGNDPDEMIPFGNGSDRSYNLLFRDPSDVYIFNDGTNTRVSFPFIRGNDGYGFTSPVGRLLPNPFGLHDMAGNAMEWCRDWYGSSYYNTAPIDDPQGPDTGTQRIWRGGGWYNPAQVCRSSFRGAEEPSTCYACSGFRVVFVLDQ